MGIVATGEYSDKSHKYITYECNVCGYHGKMRKSHYRSGVSCAVCSGKKVMCGYNDVATIRPDLLRYFAEKDDAKYITPYSHKIARMKCPICGHIADKRMSDVSIRGFKCALCYGGFSYPSRFIAALLYVSSIEFETEKTFSWSGNFRYDFYIPKYRLLLEVNGVQHYEETNYSKDMEETIRKDDEKLALAITNEYHFERIDARKSSFQWLKLSTELSGLSEYIDMSSVNWDEIKKISEVEMGLNILNLWNSGIRSTSTIASKLKMSTSTARKYLKLYRDMNECDYIESKAVLENQRLAAQSRKKIVSCINTGEIFCSIKEAADRTGINYNSIQNCIAGRSESAGKDSFGNKLKWKYID